MYVCALLVSCAGTYSKCYMFERSDSLSNPSISSYFPSLPSCFFLPSFLPSSFHSLAFSVALSHSSFPPQSLNSSSRFSLHTKGSVSLYYTPPLAQPPNRHTQLFLDAFCLQEPPRMSNSFITVLGRQTQPLFLDTDQGGSLHQLLLAQCSFVPLSSFLKAL